jgi:putative peptide zinc metalloprotease protein
MIEVNAQITPEVEDFALPPIRNDIDIYIGPKTFDGAPTWTLYDKAQNRFVRIGWLEFELLKRWSEGSAQKVIDRVNKETTLSLNNDDVNHFMFFLIQNNFIVVAGPDAREHLMHFVEIKKQGFFKFILKKYLFFYVPLIHPSKFLEKTLPLVKFIFNKYFFIFMAILLFTSLTLLMRQWDDFIHTFPYFFSFEGFLIYASGIIFAKVLHELGHAYTATYYGIKVPTMGVAFLVMWPVLYTDATDAWRLTSKKQRLYIGAAGMITELMLAIVASLVWSFLPDGPLKSVAFIFATVTWIITLVVNLSPFLRFDGYFLMSDYLGIENLHARAFAVTRWKLREWFFNYGDNPPEYFTPKMRKTLIFLGFGTWIYRFLLFLGIALIVYFLFFKVLGIILMLVEIGWFIVLPIYNELKVWIKMREKSRWSKLNIVLFFFLSFILFIFIFPWKTTLTLPAILKSSHYIDIYPPFESMVKTIHVKQGDKIQKGQLLFTLASPETDHKLEQSQKAIEALEWKLTHQTHQGSLLEQKKVIEEQLVREKTKYVGYKQKLDKLLITAPFDGELSILDESLRPHMWINDKWVMGQLLKPDEVVTEAYLVEGDFNRLKPSAEGYFYAEDFDMRRLLVTVENIEPANLTFLNELYHASIFGGDLAVKRDEKQRFMLQKSTYRVILKTPDIQVVPHSIVKGHVHVDGERKSYFMKFFSFVTSAFIRQSGF